jgi:hypothetical protein
VVVLKFQTRLLLFHRQNRISDCPIKHKKLMRENLNFYFKTRKISQTFYLDLVNKEILVNIIKIVKEILALTPLKFIMNIIKMILMFDYYFL